MLLLIANKWPRAEPTPTLLSLINLIIENKSFATAVLGENVKVRMAPSRIELLHSRCKRDGLPLAYGA